MKYRILALALALVMVAGLMSACGAPAAESAAAPSTSEKHPLRKDLQQKRQQRNRSRFPRWSIL